MPNSDLWVVDVPELWYEWKWTLRWVHSKQEREDEKWNQLKRLNWAPLVVNEWKIQVWWILDLTMKWIIGNTEIKIIKDSLWVLEKWSKEVKSDSLKRIFEVLWMWNLLSGNARQSYWLIVTNNRINFFLENHYDDILKLLLDYENALTFLSTEPTKISEKLWEIMWRIKSKIIIFYS